MIVFSLLWHIGKILTSYMNGSKPISALSSATMCQLQKSNMKCLILSTHWLRNYSFRVKKRHVFDNCENMSVRKNNFWLFFRHNYRQVLAIQSISIWGVER
jgi:hypothetical protein